MAQRVSTIAGHVAPPTQVTPEQISRGCRGYEASLLRNWNGNVEFKGRPVLPASIEELQGAVRAAAAPVRVVGRGHSFTPLAECEGGTLISLAFLRRVLDFRTPTAGQHGSITVEGGATYTDIIQFMGRRGALKNMPSCPQFTVAGAIATGTHGAGPRIQNLACHVSMLEFVKADGSLVRYSREETPELLEGCRTHLGCLGVVSRLTVDVVPFYEVDRYLYLDVPLDPVLESLPRLSEACDSLSVWTSGLGVGEGRGRCWVAFRHFEPHWIDASLQAPPHQRPKEMDGGRLAVEPLPRYCDPKQTPSVVVTGKRAWHDSLTLTMDGGKETTMEMTDIQAEFFVRMEDAPTVIKAFREETKSWTCGPPQGWSGAEEPPRVWLVDAMEFRQVKGDSGWLSPHPVDSLGIHISFNGLPENYPKVLDALPKLERVLQRYGARAHWGKLAPVTFAPDNVRRLYGEGLEKFRGLCRAHDPEGKFRNAFVRQMLFAD